MLRRFASINDPERIAFMYDSENYSTSAPIDAKMLVYQTYGDGITQHGGVSPISAELFGDYMASLAATMLADEELTKHLTFDLLRRPCDAEMKFAASVIFKGDTDGSSYEKKTRYFSVEEKKVTSNREKQYDKRYERVAPCNDGSPMAIYSMVIPRYASGLERYAYAVAVRDWCDANGGRYMPVAALALNWTDDSDTAYDMDNGFEAARAVAESFRLRDVATRRVENARRRVENKRKESATVAA